MLTLKETLREQISDLRRAIFALRPVQFDDLGFLGGLRRYITQFAGQQAWRARVDMGNLSSAGRSSGLPALSPEVEAVIFRVIQEGLTNVAKHAGASQVDVLIKEEDGGLQLKVEARTKATWGCASCRRARGRRDSNNRHPSSCGL
jgi:signal transduction histidine kinase